MTRSSQLALALLTTCAALTPYKGVQAFWFLPGFGDNNDEARALAFYNSNTTNEELAEDGHSDQTVQSNDDDATQLASVVPANRPEFPVQIEKPPAIDRGPALNDFDFALAQLDLGSVTNAMELGTYEVDLQLAAEAFDPTYDLQDAAIERALGTFPIVAFLEVEAGDTLSALFQSVGISITETQNAGRALSDVFNLGGLRPGQIIELELDGAVEPYAMGRLQRISLSPTTLEQIEVVQKDGVFESHKSEISLNRMLIFAGGTLATGSVYPDGDAMNIDGSMIANYVNALDSQLDFSRIQSVGDEIEMVYEAYFDDNGRLVDAGDVLYAAFIDDGGKTYEAFRFENDNRPAYFTRDARFTGRTNTLMRKPLGGGRLSSRYGMRIHPVYGDRRMHHGVDYAASCGTPVYAAGNGTITFAGWKGGYGRFIGVKHGPTFTTNYAHLKSFANGMRPGVRVRKGQLIGRVGTTGVSTGCHLHYEVVRGGRKINPLSEHIPRGNDLNAAAKNRFLAYVSQIDSERESGVTIAQALDLAKTGNFQ